MLSGSGRRRKTYGVRLRPGQWAAAPGHFPGRRGDGGQARTHDEEKSEGSERDGEWRVNFWRRCCRWLPRPGRVLAPALFCVLEDTNHPVLALYCAAVCPQRLCEKPPLLFLVFYQPSGIKARTPPSLVMVWFPLDNT